MDRQRISEQLKFLAIEIELGRPSWTEVLRVGIDLVHATRPLAEAQFAQAGALCIRCGKPRQ